MNKKSVFNKWDNFPTYFLCLKVILNLSDYMKELKLLRDYITIN